MSTISSTFFVSSDIVWFFGSSFNFIVINAIIGSKVDLEGVKRERKKKKKTQNLYKNWIYTNSTHKFFGQIQNRKSTRRECAKKKQKNIRKFSFSPQCGTGKRKSLATFRLRIQYVRCGISKNFSQFNGRKCAFRFGFSLAFTRFQIEKNGSLHLKNVEKKNGKKKVDLIDCKKKKNKQKTFVVSLHWLNSLK